MLDGKQSSVGKEKACFNERMRFEADKPHIVENGSVLRGQYLVVIEAIISTTNSSSTNSLSISTSNGWDKKISDQEASDDLTHSNGCAMS